MKRMKWVTLALALVLTVAIGLLVMPTQIQAAAEGYYTYTVSGGEATITGCDITTGAITIPSTLNGYPVTVIGDFAFDECTDLTSVIIGDSVTTSVTKRSVTVQV